MTEKKSKKQHTTKKAGRTKIDKARYNLVIASDSYLPRWDGVARFLHDIVPTLRKKFDITIIAPKFRGKKPEMKGVDEILMPLRNITVGDYDFPVVQKGRMKEAIRHADLVWIQAVGPIGRSAASLAKRYKKKTVAYVHSIEWELFSRAIGQPLLYNPLAALTRSYVKKTYNSCDLVLLPSHGVANLFKWYKITPKQAIAPLGVNTKKFVPPESKIEAKKKLGINPNATVVGYVGRLAYEKDLKTLVRAYQRQRDLHEDLQLLLVGSGVDDLRLKLEKIRGVVIAGNQNDVVPYYQAMDIYVLPSLTETTSLSTLEAMSCEVPVITTPVGEASKYVKNGKNGYKFSKGNSFELSHFMKLLIEDEKMRNKLGMHARRTVEENYSWDAAAKHIMGILQSVLV